MDEERELLKELLHERLELMAWLKKEIMRYPDIPIGVRSNIVSDMRLVGDVGEYTQQIRHVNEEILAKSTIPDNIKERIKPSLKHLQYLEEKVKITKDKLLQRKL